MLTGYPGKKQRAAASRGQPAASTDVFLAASGSGGSGGDGSKVHSKLLQRLLHNGKTSPEQKHFMGYVSRFSWRADTAS